jgi:hypothetical protein
VGFRFTAFGVSSLLWMVAAKPALGHAQALAAEEVIPQDSPATAPWTIDVEAGYRAQGTREYRGFYFAPGFWLAVAPGIEVGLFAPLHIRNSGEGRVGIDLSLGLEPRLRFAIADHLGGEVALSVAGEDQKEVEGVISYGAGLQINSSMHVRYTHERYNLSPAFYAQGGTGDASANFLDVAFTGSAGQRVAYAEISLILLLAAVTSGSR